MKPAHSYGFMPSIASYILSTPYCWIVSHILKKLYGFNYTKKEKRVGYITGADLMLKRSVFVEAGMFDPDFFMYGEEAEMEYRIKKMNKKIVSVPDAKIIHFGGSSVKADKRNNEKINKAGKKSLFLVFYKSHGRLYAGTAYYLIYLTYSLCSILKKEFKIEKENLKKGYMEYLKLIDR